MSVFLIIGSFLCDAAQSEAAAMEAKLAHVP
jgi:hypothetical protein